MARGRSRFAWVLLATTAAPAFAAKGLTVDQFDQLLAAERGKSASKAARQIASVELSERATSANLAQWESEFPGARNALIAIADASRFLPASAADKLNDPAPGFDTQKRMVSMAVDYVNRTMPKLPDFFATRETLHFVDAPTRKTIKRATELQGIGHADFHPYGYSGPSLQSSMAEPLHFIGRSTLVVTYRDGREVRDARNPAREKAQASAGLTTTGEFGPILSVVLGDALHGQLQWGYWEASATPAAVFRYSVPQQESHYIVVVPNGPQTTTLNPAYHGEIALDPATGEILRMVLISDLPAPYQQVQTAMMVEYAPVAIGDATFMCPVKGVAVSRIPVSGAAADRNQPAIMQTQLNDVSFTHYHLFRSETKILP